VRGLVREDVAVRRARCAPDALGGTGQAPQAAIRVLRERHLHDGAAPVHLQLRLGAHGQCIEQARELAERGHRRAVQALDDVARLQAHSRRVARKAGDYPDPRAPGRRAHHHPQRRRRHQVGGALGRRLLGEPFARRQPAAGERGLVEGGEHRVRVEQDHRHSGRRLAEGAAEALDGTLHVGTRPVDVLLRGGVQLVARGHVLRRGKRVRGRLRD
jgi:hypothetical protein